MATPLLTVTVVFVAVGEAARPAGHRQGHLVRCCRCRGEVAELIERLDRHRWVNGHAGECSCRAGRREARWVAAAGTTVKLAEAGPVRLPVAALAESVTARDVQYQIAEGRDFPPLSAVVVKVLPLAKPPGPLATHLFPRFPASVTTDLPYLSLEVVG